MPAPPATPLTVVGAGHVGSTGAHLAALDRLRDARRPRPCACLPDGPYGLEGLDMGVPDVWGRGGMERIVALPVSSQARIALPKTAGASHEDVEAVRDRGLLQVPAPPARRDAGGPDPRTPDPRRREP